jgi:hypothetical protein
LTLLTPLHELNEESNASRVDLGDVGEIENIPGQSLLMHKSLEVWAHLGNCVHAELAIKRYNANA